jgi:Type IV secretion system pilin
MKYRIIIFLVSSITLCIPLLMGQIYAQASEDTFFYGDTTADKPTTNFHTIIQNDVVQANDGVLKKILRVFNLDQFTRLSDSSALEFIKYILNIALGLVSFIAVIIVIYGFAQIIFAKDEEGITKAKKTVQGSAIAIGIIAISWFIVSFLFIIYDSFIQ